MVTDNKIELRDIAEFPDYKVSADGRVWSEKTQRWLHGSPDKDGYLQVGLYVDGKPCTQKIHRLVAKAFIPNRENLPQINHRNEIKSDNRVENLEWCDCRYNINYGSRNERAIAHRTPEHYAKLKAVSQQQRGKPVIQLTLDGKEVARFCCTREAARQTGFRQSNISRACGGEYRQSHGYIWQYMSKEA